MNKSKRVHFYVSSHGNKGVKFISSDGDIMYRAGGNDESPKFILQSLVDLYGVDVAKDVYTKMNAALLNIDRLPIEKPRAHTASFVCYKKIDDDKNEQVGTMSQSNAG